MRKSFVDSNIEFSNSGSISNEKYQHKFIDTIRQVVKILKIKSQNPYSKILEKNILSITAETEMNLDLFLDELNR